MNTTIRGGAIRRLPQTTGYADGGSVSPWSLKGIANSVKGALTKTPEQIQKEADLAEYRKNSAAEREAAKLGTRTTPTNAIASYVANTALQEREKSAGLKNGGAIKGPRGAIRGMAKMHPDVESKAEDMREPKNAERMEMRGMKCGGAIKKMANGGKLQGPGTPTSDSIPAEVVDTGEPIKVATGERIVSKKQDAFLLDQAKTAGFKSIDSWLEAGTGHPVGPTIHYQKGAIRKMASGGLIEDEKPRESLVSQIPTGGSGAGPTPQPDPSQSASGSELGRNVSNTVNALSPLSGGTQLALGASRVGGAIGSSASADKVIGNLARSAPFAAPVMGGAALAAASTADTPAGSVAPSAGAVPAPTSTASPSPTPAATSTAPAIPSAATAPTSVDSSTATETPMGYGAIRKISEQGKSPLFTNVSGPEGDASNASLMGRGAISAQNKGALDALAGRYETDARNTAQAQINNEQFDREVAGAKAVNDAGTRLNLEYTTRNGKPQEAAVAMKTLTNAEEAKLKREELGVKSEGNQLAADAEKYKADAISGAQRVANAIAIKKVGIEERKADAEQAQKSLITELDQKIINGSPAEQKNAAAQKAAIMGKGIEGAKPLTDTQGKALLFGTRMQTANEILDSLEKSGKLFSTPGANGMLGSLVNTVNSKEGQQLDQAKRDFINATLRRESGAVISDPEFENGNKQYFPQIGDSPEVVAQKRNNRMIAQAGILAEVPDSDARVAQVRAAAGLKPQQQPTKPNPEQLAELQRRAANNPVLAQRLKESGYI